MKLSEFDFSLPDGLIATRPVRPRTASRLLVATPYQIEDERFYNLPKYLCANDRLVLNDTKVIPARLSGTRLRSGHRQQSGAAMEVTLLEPTETGQWCALLKPLRKIRDGEEIVFSDELRAKLCHRLDGCGYLKFNLVGQEFNAALCRHGAMPLPPYIAAKRPADNQDVQDYQTVWARIPGAVAAPTASLHFDEILLKKLADIGVKISHITLHVGAGTFLPVKTDDISDHKMHSEIGEISKAAADEINTTRADGGRIIPVGTTALRLVEAAADNNGWVHPWNGPTDIFIKPGYQFKISDGLITNFHLPKSTLMMLVSAFIGVEQVRDIYQHAIANKYRFFSYGDSSLLLPKGHIAT